MPAHTAIYLVMPFSHNRSGEYPEHVYSILALCVICARTGLAATIVSTQDTRVAADSIRLPIHNTIGDTLRRKDKGTDRDLK